MIINFKDSEKIVSEKPRGGDGIITGFRYLDNYDLSNNLKGFYVNELDINSTIGYHIHENDEEIYFILEGTGIVIEDNDKRTPVSKGDLIYTKKGEGHGMINTGKEPLKFVAFIIEI